MNFEFATATQIIFGPGTLKQVGPLTAKLGRRALVVTGRDTERAKSLLELLAQQGVAPDIFAVPGEPTIELVQNGVQQAKTAQCEVVIGFGGGSAVDAGKAIAALLTNPDDPLEYLEVIGRGQPLKQAPLPYIAVPTTAGTGSEVTRNAVLGSPSHRVKVSLRNALMLPRLAVIDPELTYGLPPSVTASTGLDALTQVLEPYVSNKANPLTDAVCQEGLYRAARSLRRAYEHGNDTAAREDMAVTSLFGGLALANAKLGAVHGFAAVLGGMFPAPHGAVCAVLLPHVMSANVQALRERQPDSESLHRYDRIAQILTGSSNALALDGVAWVKALCQDLCVPGLATYGLTLADFATVIEKAAVSSSMQGNPIKLTTEELHEILNLAW